MFRSLVCLTCWCVLSQLLDLCLLDVRSLEFSNGVLAAAALFHFSSLELVETVSGKSGEARPSKVAGSPLTRLSAGLKRAELEECVRWMVPFAMALREVGGSSVKAFTGIPADNVHNIQTHASYMTWLVSPIWTHLPRPN